MAQRSLALALVAILFAVLPSAITLMTRTPMHRGQSVFLLGDSLPIPVGILAVFFFLLGPICLAGLAIGFGVDVLFSKGTRWGTAKYLAFGNCVFFLFTVLMTGVNFIEFLVAMGH